MLKSPRKNRGFTLIELLIVVAMVTILIVTVYGFLICTVVKGNFWFTEDGVAREIQFGRQGTVVQVVKTERRVFDLSRVVVTENGVMKTYCLDTDVLFNYSISICE